MERVSKNRVNDPFRGRNIGRRTGKAITQLKSGVADFDAYLSESDADLTLDVTKPSPVSGGNSSDISQEKCDIQEEKTRSPCLKEGNNRQAEGSTRILKVTNPFINPRFGRRTGKDILANRKRGSLSNGAENFSNFLSDCDSSVSLCPTPVKSLGTDDEKLSSSTKQSDDEDITPSSKQPARQRKTPVFKLSQKTEPLKLNNEEPVLSPVRSAETRHSVPVLELSNRKSEARENVSVEKGRRNQEDVVSDSDEGTRKKRGRSNRSSSVRKSKNESGIAKIAEDGLLEVDMNVIEKNVHRRSSRIVDKSAIACMEEGVEENVNSSKMMNRSKIGTDRSCLKSMSELDNQNIEIDGKTQKHRMSQGQLATESEKCDEDVPKSRSFVSGNDISRNAASNLDRTNLEDSPVKEKIDVGRLDDGDVTLDKATSNMTRRSHMGTDFNSTKNASDQTPESEVGNKTKGNQHLSRSRLDESSRVQNRSRKASNDDARKSALKMNRQIEEDSRIKQKGCPDQSHLQSNQTYNEEDSENEIQGNLAKSPLKRLSQLNYSQTNHSEDDKKVRRERRLVTSENDRRRTSIQSPRHEKSKRTGQKGTSMTASLIDNDQREDHAEISNVMGKSNLDAELNSRKRTSKQSNRSLGDSRVTQKEQWSRIQSDSGQAMQGDEISEVREESHSEGITISDTSDENNRGKEGTRKVQKQKENQSCLDKSSSKHDKETSMQVTESHVDANSVKLSSKQRRKSSRVGSSQKLGVSKSQQDSSRIKHSHSSNKLSSSHVSCDSSGIKSSLKQNQPVGETSSQLQQTLNSVPHAKVTTSGKESLNFGGDITGSVSQSEKASSEHFYGIKKRLTFSSATAESDVMDSKTQAKEMAPQMSFLDSHTAGLLGATLGKKQSQPSAPKPTSPEKNVDTADFNIIDSDASSRNENKTGDDEVLGKNETKRKRLSSVDDKPIRRKRKGSADVSEPSPKYDRNAEDSVTVTRKSTGLRSIAQQRQKSNSGPLNSDSEESIIPHKETPDLSERTGDQEFSTENSSLNKRKLRSRVLPERKEKLKSTKKNKVLRKSVQEELISKGKNVRKSTAEEKRARLSSVLSYEDAKSTLETSKKIKEVEELPMKPPSSKNPRKSRRKLSQKLFLPRRSSIARSFVKGERASPVRLNLLNTLPRITPRSGNSYRSRSRVFVETPTTEAELEHKVSHSDCNSDESTPLRPNARQSSSKPKKKRLVEQMTDESLAGQNEPEDEIPVESLAGQNEPEDEIPEESLAGQNDPEDEIPEESLAGQNEPEDEIQARNSSQVDLDVVQNASPLPGAPIHTDAQGENQRVPTSCLKSSNSLRGSSRKGSRRVRISDVFRKKDITPPSQDERTEQGGHSGNQSSVYPELLSLTSSPVHYFETTTSSILGSPQLEIPNLDYKIVRPEKPPPGVRRSKRTRVLRLNRDRGEGIIYKRDSTGFCLEIDSIQPSIGEAKLKLKEEKMRRVRRKKRIEATKLPQMKKKRLSTHLSVQNDVTVSTELPVINPDTNEEVLVELIGRAEDAKWAGPDLDDLKGSEKLAIGVHLNQPGFSSGQFHLGPMGKKPEELVTETLVFSITHGKICVTINDVSTVLETGDQFFIPRGTSYSIENLRRDVARLCFVCLQNLLTMPTT